MIKNKVYYIKINIFIIILLLYYLVDVVKLVHLFNNVHNIKCIMYWFRI